MDETRRIREDMKPLVRKILEENVSNVGKVCKDYLYDATNRTKAANHIRTRISSLCRPTGVPTYSGPYVCKVMQGCLTNMSNLYWWTPEYKDYTTNLFDIMVNAFKIPSCFMEKTYDGFTDVCDLRDYEDDDSIDEYYGYPNFDAEWASIADERICHAYSILKTASLGSYGDKFHAGVLLKTSTYSMVSTHLDNLLKALLPKTSIDEFPFQCILGETKIRGLESCDEKSMPLMLRNIDLVYRLKKQAIPPTSKVAGEMRASRYRENQRLFGERKPLQYEK